MHRLATLVLALLAPLLLALPAHADSPVPVLDYPIRSSAAEVVVQVNAEPKTWGIRRAARRMDALVPGLTVRTSGDCSTADLCVTVLAGRYETPEMMRLSEGHAPSWTGLMVYPSDRERVIYLNRWTAYSNETRTQTAAHEFGHALGLAHHSGYGLMSTSRSYKMRAPWLSDEELALLQSWYGNPSARA